MFQIFAKESLLVFLPIRKVVLYSIPNYKAFWLFLNIAFRQCISKCIVKAMHLEKPKCLIIWNGGSSTLNLVDRFVPADNSIPCPPVSLFSGSS